MPKYKGNITIKIDNAREERTYEDVELNISRSSMLMIASLNEAAFDFFEDIHARYKIDKNANMETNYTFETSEPSTIEISKKYRVTRINEDKHSITFKGKFI